MLGVDDLGQVLAVDLLLKDPHLDLVVKVVESAHVATDNLGDGRTPKKNWWQLHINGERVNFVCVSEYETVVQGGNRSVMQVGDVYECV